MLLAGGEIERTLFWLYGDGGKEKKKIVLQIEIEFVMWSYGGGGCV